MNSLILSMPPCNTSGESFSIVKSSMKFSATEVGSKTTLITDGLGSVLAAGFGFGMGRRTGVGSGLGIGLGVGPRIV